MFADIHVSAIYADEIITHEKIISFQLKNSIVARIYMSRFHEVKRYNFDENNNLKDVSHFILENDKIVEIIKP